MILEFFKDIPIIDRTQNLSLTSTRISILAKDPSTWKTMSRYIDRDWCEANCKNDDRDVHEIQKHLVEILLEANSFGLIESETLKSVTSEDAKELKDKIDDIKIRDTIKVWKELQKSVPSLTAFDFESTKGMRYKQALEASNTWFDNKKGDRKSTRLNSSHIPLSRMPSSA